ncbi:SpoIIE family protein phosphatase [Bdellovibrio svalbardensis]|uniref:SpoIIE family protein phosphatase n=1 Tax=Bdellovibrio svalbardensis TaxID=2972972 RepID=A0ABT6DHN7_9BACT|nr:SpoIIE family protein phosphatase [Bdellovibrio svalbardensis]MDG0815434.1 SpoIIE family protein phosphatase [Bdellovibrio svalbardensis]
MNGQQVLEKNGLSLKYKILLLLIGISSVGLGSFLWLSVRNFTNDKSNYVLESTTQFTLSQTEIINQEIEKSLDFLRMLADHYNAEELRFSTFGTDLFQTQRTVSKLQLVRIVGPKMEFGIALNKSSEPLPFNEIPFYRLLKEKHLYLLCNPNDPAKFVAVYRLRSNDYTYMVGEILVPHIKNLADNPSYEFALYCADAAKAIINISPKVPDLDVQSLKKEFEQSRIFTRKINADNKEYLLGVSPLATSGIFLIGSVDTGKVMGVIRDLQKQAVLFFISLLGVICIIALFSANHLTMALEQLTVATQKIAAGDFTSEVKVSSKDELLTLANSFNWMKGRILELLEKTKQSARMEAELETATTVQRTLFPAKVTEAELYQIHGEYRTASECGGDLWHHFDNGKKLFLFIGDVVGHGVPSALMTTAARSVTAIVKLQGEERPAEILKLLNHCIHETSKGEMWMTFFVGVYDKESGCLTYASASQNPPFFFPNQETVSKSDIMTLMESRGPSLGRQEQSEYEEATFQMDPGSLIFFYTDGLTECVNPAKELLGESRLVRSLAKVWSKDKSSAGFCAAVSNIMDDYRKGHPFEDDVTFFCLKRLS